MELETSPHTRGELDPDAVLGLILGNIPAYAGRPLHPRSCRKPFLKHPRIRGENRCRGRRRTETGETSPHTRGEHSRAQKILEDVRNIPAYAGRTQERRCRNRKRQKHPRIRGENTFRDGGKSFFQETSPHTRGEPAG